ncbi:hypothetical protein IU474_27385 [Nocardia otitidiscaviarum]|uniref:hypothetical protein n=1 Tax=Nocardia otitidiscaviarum TaxID=1823 RepID=UPI001895576D|nr:hypothetical protein [Nocardia otitidiscaviarum]MBF6240775.1 hypothetical protein [Nocardia otitidiscaviarum]
MAHSDVSDSRFGLGDLLGLRGGAGWLFLVILEATIALYMYKNFHGVPFWPALAGMALMLAAGALVMVVPVDPLPVPVALFAAAAGPASAGLTVMSLSPGGQSHSVWTAYASSYVLAVLVLRGRVRIAWVGVAAIAAVVAVAGMGPQLEASAVVGSIVPIGTVAAITVFAAIMRPMQRSLRLLREEAMLRAAAEATMSAADNERTRQLTRLDRVAGPILERIADGVELTVSEREECRLLEAELRDGLRAPQLVTDELSCAARGARSRGVEVVLLDDGGFTGVPEWVRKRVIDAATRELDAANTGTVTVRVLPLGRRLLATVLATGPERDQRTEIDTDGKVTVG